MNDSLENKLEIGDLVFMVSGNYGGGFYIKQGIITGFTPKKVKVADVLKLNDSNGNQLSRDDILKSMATYSSTYFPHFIVKLNIVYGYTNDK